MKPILSVLMAERQEEEFTRLRPEVSFFVG